MPDSNLVKIQVDLRDGTNKPLAGWIQVTADANIQDFYNMPKILVTRQPGKENLVNGKATLNLPNSEDSGVTYLFEWGYTDTATVPPTDVVIDGFRAIVPRPTQIAPNTWLPVDLASLVPTGIQLGSLDATASRIARVIVEDPELRAKALQQFNLRGVFQPTQQYQYGDLVVVTGSPNQVWVVQTHGLVAPAAAVNTTQWLRLL